MFAQQELRCLNYLPQLRKGKKASRRRGVGCGLKEAFWGLEQKMGTAATLHQMVTTIIKSPSGSVAELLGSLSTS